MKIVSIIGLLLLLHNSVKGQTTYSPSCNSNVKELTITKIEVTSSSTIVNLKFYTTNANYRFSIQSGMYIQQSGNSNGTKYYIKEFVGNKLDVIYKNEPNTTYNFTFIFEKIPNGLTQINILEPVAKEGWTSWYWKNITINNSSSSSYVVKNYTHAGYSYNLHSFLMGSDVKVKYFAQNGYSRYQNWKYGKDILLVCSGAFSETWESNSKPIGFTIDNGLVINLNMNSEMDGFVFIFDDFIATLDLDYLQSGITLDDGSTVKINPRNSTADRTKIKNWAIDESLTIFQTQLLYSQDNSYNFNNLTYGKQRERRFLAICTKNSNYYNVIVDAPSQLYLNQSAKYAKSVLEYDGFTVHYILNLDTGDKNICLVKDGSSLKNIGNTSFDNATNLIIFYK